MKFYYKLQLCIMALLICCLSVNIVYSENNIFVDQYSARAIGIGNAFTPIADDATAVLYNPAGVGQFSDKTYFNSMYANVHNLSIFNNYVLCASTKYNEDIGMGGAWVYERIDLDPEIWAQHRLFYSLSYALMEHFTVGCTGKLIIISTDFDGYEKVWGYGVDSGILASSDDWGLKFLDKNNMILKLGLHIENIYTRIDWDDENKEIIPLRSGFGGMINYNDMIQFSVQFKSRKEDLTTIAFGTEFFLLRTLEYEINDVIKIDEIVLRAGIEQEKIIASSTGFSGGLGIIAKNFMFDYAVLTHKDYFSATHYFSIGMVR